jgi:CRP/FNR family transcriptional regulator, cyclic AMP receptor protein
MDGDTSFDVLTDQPFLAGFTRPQLDKLALWSKRKVFHAGVRLFEEGGRADRFWLIREGHVTLDTHVPGRGSVIVETLGPGAVLGWSWLFPPYRWHFSASAIETTLAIEFDGPGIRELCAQHQEIGYELMNRFLTVVVDRMQATRLRLLDLYAGRPA